MVYTYILECADGSFYTGITNNLERRVWEHNQHIKSCLQKSKLPAVVKYYEEHQSRIEAAKREKEIKGWSRKKKIQLFDSGG
jgi:putative endonuclease